MRSTTKLLGAGVCCLVMIGVVGCGGDDDKTTPTPIDNEGGAGSDSFPEPALGKADCATTTSKLTLTQPEGAGVWGGLVVIEFEVEGSKTQSFDLQLFDPALGIWLNSYYGYEASGQREDGSYFFVVRPPFSMANRDGEMRVRVRPTQDGCPRADWTESKTFTAGDPVAGTSWTGEVTSDLLYGSVYVQRTPIGVEAPPLPAVEVTPGDASVSVKFGSKGEFTEQVTLALNAEEGGPFADCTLSLTFGGTYSLVLRSYGSMNVLLSELSLTSTKGTTCKLPTVKELALSGETFDIKLPAYQQGVGIDYLPTVYVEPSNPTWQNAFINAISAIPQFMSYTTADEYGSASGSFAVQELVLVQD